MRQGGAARRIFGQDLTAWKPFTLADFAVSLGSLTVLYLVARVGSESLVRFAPPDVVPVINLDPANLPNYAARSTLRMFIALCCSFGFTLVYGYIAAHSRRAEKSLFRC